MQRALGDQEEARKLRKQGKSVREIAEELGRSKSSISVWVRGIELDDAARARLRTSEQHASGVARANGLETIRSQREARWQASRKAADDAWRARLSDDRAFLFALALYAGEGTKCSHNMVEFSNTDPRLVRAALVVFTEAGCRIEQLRVRINVHSAEQIEPAEAHWSRVTGVPRDQFHKAQIKGPVSGRRLRRGRHPFGVCHIRACNTDARQKVGRWLELALQDFAAEHDPGRVPGFSTR